MASDDSPGDLTDEAIESRHCNANEDIDRNVIDMVI